MNTLFIDTTSNAEIVVRLVLDDKTFEEKIAIQNNRAQVVLPTIEKLLKQQGLKVQDIEKVEINPGPGSFTGVRVGSAIANALIFSLGLPQERIEPLYSQ
ncbi:MAG TPA: tRNA (adenosine(37)-N6)-threonylcarbamoyltransferase complex dimerization subunit type 1 TsaB [Patescibacteria group bacterium]|nr:tRNA (adenosine(37)-N6)-threonylcarbamoyltransferase complex dimerization subunit type 1 TsaB [Patescibacteria group bacterium]